jgi:hypothetical protein
MGTNLDRPNYTGNAANPPTRAAAAVAAACSAALKIGLLTRTEADRTVGQSLAYGGLNLRSQRTTRAIGWLLLPAASLLDSEPARSQTQQLPTASTTASVTQETLPVFAGDGPFE